MLLQHVELVMLTYGLRIEISSMYKLNYNRYMTIECK